MNRRDLVKGITLFPLVGGSTVSLAASTATPPPERDFFKELGIRVFINAAGTYTFMTASLMPPEVVEAIRVSAKQFAILDDVQDKVGEQIAKLCKAEAAMVTAGCWSALVLGMAGILTGVDDKKVALLPFLEGSGMKSEVIVQKSHANGYHMALTHTGVKIVTVETREELRKAVNEKTACLWFLNREAPVGAIKHEEWLSLAKEFGIPTMIDIAADVPPVENLWRFNEMGFDLVCISGGKALQGPQSAGVLMGKKQLIAAARLSAPPRSGIARGHKVNKEEIIGMYAALDRYVKLDHTKEWKAWEQKIGVIDTAVKKVKGVKTEVIVPPVANHTPSLKITWDPNVTKLTSEALGKQLRTGSPSIEIVSWEDKDSVKVTVFMLKTGEDEIVAKRLREELEKASKA
ncbi:aminotransferase class V-fold PLP-dependent enzyme [Chryseolinea soli]|uniref:Aminotransferase class V-fold PLP-dependent enzyme n=1 Tax=Chryseolinea soli TaxID=2321403 RepID=A0A385SG31_9BACT|nr:aminotransferase class V-fold PLP-dependent enzyme [Chryseolinea soli]AYB29366.1 aminotransferase class V-fold PLP-dependent enzyme [Chryseolinea soli]